MNKSPQRNKSPKSHKKPSFEQFVFENAPLILSGLLAKSSFDASSSTIVTLEDQAVESAIRFYATINEQIARSTNSRNGK
jgi:hypothetical protein